MTERVKFEHWRVVGTPGSTPRPPRYIRGLIVRADIQPRGGETVAAIYNEDGMLVASGSAVCSPKDNYCKARGRAIALGRARKAMGR